MENNNKDDRYFGTPSFYLACFLFSKGLELINIDRVDPRRAEFVFIDTPEREKLLNDFNFAKEDFPGVLIDARKFVVAIKSLKDKLYQP